MTDDAQEQAIREMLAAFDRLRYDEHAHFAAVHPWADGVRYLLRRLDAAPFVEPEGVVHWNCPHATVDEHDGMTAPQMTRTGSLDDAAGRQRRYGCPECFAEITVDFPPQETTDAD